MDKKLISQLYKALANHYGIAVSETIEEKDKVKIINKIDTENKQFADLIQEYCEAVASINYFKDEKEMRIKFPEIWEMQIAQAKEKAEVFKLQLIDTAKENGLALNEVFEKFEKGKLNLDDLAEML